MGNPLTKAVGNILTKLVGNVLTELVGKVLDIYIPNLWSRVLTLCACGIGSPILGYSLILNNLVPASAFLTIIFTVVIGLKFRYLKDASIWYFLVGVLSALLATFELPAVLFSLACWLYLLMHNSRKTIIWYSMGALPIITAHLVLSYHIVGTILPAASNFDLFHYPGSPWIKYISNLDIINEPKIIYIFHSTFGRKGMFLLFPMLMVSISYIIGLWWKKEVILKKELIGYLFLVITLILFYSFILRNYGGACYTIRWFIYFIPLLFFPLGLYLRKLNILKIFLFILLFLVSCYSSYQCINSPWKSNNEWTTKIFGKIL